MNDWPELTIGEVARRAGVASSTIRYYESIELLPEPIREHGQRRYDETVLGRLGFVGVAQSAGFSLDQIQGTDGERRRRRRHGPADAVAFEPKARRGRGTSRALKAMKGWLEVAKE